MVALELKYAFVFVFRRRDQICGLCARNLTCLHPRPMLRSVLSNSNALTLVYGFTAETAVAEGAATLKLPAMPETAETMLSGSDCSVITTASAVPKLPARMQNSPFM